MSFLKIIFLLLTVAVSLLFIAAIPAIGSREKGLSIHKEMSPDAGAFMVNAKGVVTAMAGFSYMMAAAGILLGIKPLMAAGTVGAAGFCAFYIIELFLWAVTYPPVWAGFATAGLHSILTGAYCLKLCLAR